MERDPKGETVMAQRCERCGNVLIREEAEEGTLCFECFEARLPETPPEEKSRKKIGGVRG